MAGYLMPIQVGPGSLFPLPPAGLSPTDVEDIIAVNSGLAYEAPFDFRDGTAVLIGTTATGLGDFALNWRQAMASVINGSITAAPIVSIGTNSPSYNNLTASWTLTGLDTEGEFIKEVYTAATALVGPNVGIYAKIITLARTDVPPAYNETIDTGDDQYTDLEALWLTTGAPLSPLEDRIGALDLTPFNAPTSATSTWGNVLTLAAASSQYMGVTGTPVAALPLTINIWYQVSTLPGAGTLFYMGPTDAISGSPLVVLYTGPDYAVVAQVQSAPGAGNTDAFATAPTTPNTKTMLTLVIASDTSRKVYVNGALAATGDGGKSIDPTAEFDSTYIGAFQINSAFVNFLQGQVFEARVYSSALSDADVLALYTAATRWNLYDETGGTMTGTMKIQGTYQGA